ncbi:hypothetical protein C8A03DRAFT_34855 [Achaetomium macrosporum]|uniref:Uncharacterized protein n=1 Tax=Achaetomium macrosporum TaxID=79813 RepID=A0AAN7CA47_9PEZI|nr:hypothetical protein C8A03DRAFT_34855 [Achaetomium macrosporum]
MASTGSENKTQMDAGPVMDGTHVQSPSPQKTVKFSEEVQLRIVDAEDGSVLSVEKHDLSAYTTLNNAARQIDSNLWFLHPNYKDKRNLAMLEGRPPWGYLALDQLLLDYRRRGTEQDIELLALESRRPASSVLFALSRIAKKIEDLKGEQQEEENQTDITAAIVEKTLRKVYKAVNFGLAQGVTMLEFQRVVEAAFNHQALPKHICRTENQGPSFAGGQWSRGSDAGSSEKRDRSPSENGGTLEEDEGSSETDESSSEEDEYLSEEIEYTSREDGHVREVDDTSSDEED